jgi:hypothetical protein
MERGKSSHSGLCMSGTIVWSIPFEPFPLVPSFCLPSTPPGCNISSSTLHRYRMLQQVMEVAQGAKSAHETQLYKDEEAQANQVLVAGTLVRQAAKHCHMAAQLHEEVVHMWKKMGSATEQEEWRKLLWEVSVLI